MRRREASWILVSSILSLNEYFVKTHLEKVMDMWDNALGGSTTKLPIEEPGISYTLRNRAAAVISFNTFIRQCPALLSQERLLLILKYIGNTMYVL